MKNNILLTLLFILTLQFGNSQCAECPAGSTVITGSDNLQIPNVANDYCIEGEWTGTISNIGNGSTITVCPTATWTIPQDVLLQQQLEIHNFGTITDGGAGHKLFIQGNTNLTNEASGTITVADFENQDTEFVNLGSLTAENIYLHGPSNNMGTITSTADCGGTATQQCGFFLGNKNEPFINTGTVNTVDAAILDQVAGGIGIINSTGNLVLSVNGGESDNTFNVNNLTLGVSSTVSSGSFEISGDLECNNANIQTDMCFTATGDFSNTCSNNSDPVIACSALPVTFIDFDVKGNGSKQIFSWEVAAEFNVSHYEVLSSTDGKNYQIATTLKANSENFYQTSRRTDVNGIEYFKLKSVDLDGTESVHTEIIKLQNRIESNYKIWPNPASINDNLRIDFDEEQNVLVILHSIDGREIKSMHYQNQSSIELPLQDIQQSGLYIVKILTANQVYTEEIFVR